MILSRWIPTVLRVHRVQNFIFHNHQIKISNVRHSATWDRVEEFLLKSSKKRDKIPDDYRTIYSIKHAEFYKPGLYGSLGMFAYILGRLTLDPEVYIGIDASTLTLHIAAIIMGSIQTIIFIVTMKVLVLRIYYSEKEKLYKAVTPGYNPFKNNIVTFQKASKVYENATSRDGFGFKQFFFEAEGKYIVLFSDLFDHESILHDMLKKSVDTKDLQKE